MESRNDEEIANPSDPPGKMWAIDQRMDQPLGPESSRVRIMNDGRQAVPAKMLLTLAFQSLGIVYGDLGTSPLYVYKSTFPQGLRDKEHNAEDILGVLCLVIYTLTLIPLIKYMFIVLRADDNGEGGTFALYSLLCRHCKFNSLPNRHPTDEELTTYSVQEAKPNSFADWLRRKCEKSKGFQSFLLVLVLLSTCMVIGDGILTPAISVLSAVDGIKKASSKLDQSVVVVISLLILISLFSVQRFGTGYIGFLFAPIVLMWFLANGTIGVYNISKYDFTVFRAFSPHFGIQYLVRNKKIGWSSLGGVVLCITGTEALYADLGHFSARSIQIAFSVLVFPCLLLSYFGQAAFLIHHPEKVTDAFYSSVPRHLYWPMFVLATVAASIASQAIISATFSIVKQSAALGCFPRIKIMHTSDKLQGQVYIPEVNWIVMVLCLVITASFQDTQQIGNAYGIAVVGVMLSTTIIMSLVMVIVWRKNFFLALLFFGIFGAVESVYYSAVLFKVLQGGWVPLAIAITSLTVMYVWHFGTVKRYEFEIQNKVSVGWVLGLGQGIGLVRVPGVGLVYTDLAHGVPPILSHFITNLPAIHSILVFVCIKYLPVNTVPSHERFHIKRIGPRSFSMFRCAARYGYKDLHKKDDDFEQDLISKLALFIKYEEAPESSNDAEGVPDDWTSISTNMSTASQRGDTQTAQNSLQNSVSTLPLQISEGNNDGIPSPELQSVSLSVSSLEDFVARVPRLRGGRPRHPAMRFPSTDQISEESISELEALEKNRDAGVVYLVGNIVMRARTGSGLLKRLAINYIYAFLRKTCRESLVVYSIPHESLLQVGMVYYV